MAFESIAQLLQTEKEKNKPLWEVILEDDLLERHTSREESVTRMRKLVEAMKNAVKNYEPSLRSASGFIGGDGERMERFVESGKSISGGFIGKVITVALKMGESNACMKRIVAAPTAGACGVLPAAVITLSEEYSISDDKVLEALYVAAGVGQIIAHRAFISGAEGGCQAEIGTASAMASAALVWLSGGTSEAASQACAMTLKNLLGLVCDPVSGLVEVPCVKRNVIGAINAVACADMALAGIKSVIPADEVIDAMSEVGRELPASLRETGEKGLAGTHTGRKIKKEICRLSQTIKN